MKPTPYTILPCMLLSLALLMLVPIANFVMPLFLAFSKWPLERKLEDAQVAAGVSADL